MTNSWRLSPALLLAFIALLVALGGTAVANADRLPLIGSHHVADNSLRSKDIRDGTLKRRDFRSGALRGRSGALDPVSVTPHLGLGHRVCHRHLPFGRAGPLRRRRLDGRGNGAVVAALERQHPMGVISSDATAIVVAYAYCSADVTVTP